MSFDRTLRNVIEHILATPFPCDIRHSRGGSAGPQCSHNPLGRDIHSRLPASAGNVVAGILSLRRGRIMY
jgi:hypothetical protein